MKLLRRITALALTFVCATVHAQALDLRMWTRTGDTTLIEGAGGVSARISAPERAAWDLSSLRRTLPTVSGDIWSVVVGVSADPDDRLVGACRAVVNIEWHDDAGRLIVFESHRILDSDPMPGESSVSTVGTQAAPAGAASVTVVVGVLRSPGADSGSVIIDSVSVGVVDGSAIPLTQPTNAAPARPSAIEVRFVTADGSPPVITDLSVGVELYLQARIIGDDSATGLTAFEGLLMDGGLGVFSKGKLTFTEAIGVEMPGMDPLERTGMFPSYRSTIGNDNDNPGNGLIKDDAFFFLPINVSSSGNGEGLEGEWANVYKIRWTTDDPSLTSATLTAGGTSGGFQSNVGLRQPVPVSSSDLEVTINLDDDEDDDEDRDE